MLESLGLNSVADSVYRLMLMHREWGVQQIAATVSRSCLSLNPNTAQTPDAKRASRPLNEQMLRRGVAIRCIYQESFRNDANLLEYAHWLTSLGGEARTVPVVPMPLIIYDRSTVLLPIDPAGTSRGALEIRTSGVVALACALFDQLWAGAMAFDVRALSDSYPTADAARVVGTARRRAHR